jgi:hypothetical protein
MKLTKHDIKRIDGIARRVRLKFPCSAGACYYSSQTLLAALRNAGYSSARMLHGTFYLDNPDPSQYNYAVSDEQAHHAPHYWVQIGDIIIDTTAEQFEYEIEGGHIPKVVIGRAVDLWRYEVED